MAPGPTKDVEFHVPATRVCKVLSRLRSMHNDMTILQAMIFFRIAAEPGVTQRTVWAEFDTFDSVLSRGVAVLSSAGVRNTKPLHLVELRENPKDRREKLLYLSNRGRMLMEDILRDLDMAPGGRPKGSSGGSGGKPKAITARKDGVVELGYDQESGAPSPNTKLPTKKLHWIEKEACE